jgi:hypothetical protein
MEVMASKMEAGNKEEELGVASEAFFLLPSLCFNEKGKVHKARKLKSQMEGYLKETDENLGRRVRAEVMALRIKQKKRKPLDAPLASPPLSEEERLRTGIHKVVKLAEQNELSRALRLLESLASEAKHISDTEARSDKRAEQIRGLHPNASENDKLPTRSREDREISDLALTMDDLEEGLNQLPALSAGAMSPWTYDLIKCAAGKRGDENFRATILRVFNLILAGKGGDPEYWVSSRLVAIGKPDGGLRPIAVGEVWYRFLASMVARITGKDIGPSLAPCQYGVAISAGGTDYTSNPDGRKADEGPGRRGGCRMGRGR